MLKIDSEIAKINNQVQDKVFGPPPPAELPNKDLPSIVVTKLEPSVAETPKETLFSPSDLSENRPGTMTTQSKLLADLNINVHNTSIFSATNEFAAA